MTYKPKKRKNKMSKQAEERAKKAYPLDAPKTIKSVQEILQETYIEGYEQAEKDIISIIESRLSELLGDAQPTPILRAELSDLIKKIEEV